MYIPSNLDLDIPVKRLQLDVVTGKLMSAPKKELFIKGPIPLEWLAKAAALPGKTLNVAMALWWHHGMAGGKAFQAYGYGVKAPEHKKGCHWYGINPT